MIRKPNILVHYILPAFLAAALLFPTTLQFSHLFADHEHKECGEVVTHLHEKKTDCDINLFHFSQLFDGLAATYESSIVVTPSKTFLTYTLQHHKSYTHSIYLRGPPAVIS